MYMKRAGTIIPIKKLAIITDSVQLLLNVALGKHDENGDALPVHITRPPINFDFPFDHKHVPDSRVWEPQTSPFVPDAQDITVTNPARGQLLDSNKLKKMGDEFALQMKQPGRTYVGIDLGQKDQVYATQDGFGQAMHGLKETFREVQLPDPKEADNSEEGSDYGVKRQDLDEDQLKQFKRAVKVIKKTYIRVVTGVHVAMKNGTAASEDVDAGMRKQEEKGRARDPNHVSILQITKLMQETGYKKRIFSPNKDTTLEAFKENAMYIHR
ncbi:hypothetical protein HDU76_010515, partial [Blyttiomyces sp. JEL0837]